VKNAFLNIKKSGKKVVFKKGKQESNPLRTVKSYIERIGRIASGLTDNKE